MDNTNFETQDTQTNGIDTESKQLADIVARYAAAREELGQFLRNHSSYASIFADINPMEYKR